VVAIVTGGSSRAGRDVARGLAGWGWAIVVVYLEHETRADVTVAEILAAHGRTVAVRADLADDLDVARLFAESIAAFGAVDAVAHTTSARASPLYAHAARNVRPGGVIVRVPGGDGIAPDVARQLRAREIAVGEAPPEAVPAYLDAWRRNTAD
jgi:NAD(P)-dependent dehydrogenase (short-subunit alcohol dehydrogenase family)